MNYPLISEYIKAIKKAEENFEQLVHLRPVLDDDGQPVMTSGNFAVVFKMRDEQTGKLHAVKCFIKEQEGRAEAYRLIAEELEYVSSTFLTPIKYLDKELFVDSKNTDETEFPVLLMDWVEGLTLDKYIREHIDDHYELSLLAYQFSRLAMWLLPQPFAHGDLKPDNILVKEDGTLVLVDYDGMYVPAMKGQKARELGSPDFRHPSRTEDDFDEHIDDFSLVSILLSLKAIALQPELLEQYGASDRLLLSANDYRNLSESQVMDALKLMMQDTELATLYSLFILSSAQNNLSQASFRLLNLSRPKEQEMTEEEIEAGFRAWEEEMAPYDVAKSWSFDSFIKEFKIISFQHGSAYYSVTDGGEDAIYFRSKDGKRITVFNQSGLTTENIITQRDDITIELMKSGHYIICGYGTKASDYELRYVKKDEDGVMYSEDHIKLIGVYGSYLPEYEIAEGTEVICDNALNGFRSEIEDLMISGKITIPSSVRYIGRNPFRGDYDTIICKSPHFVVENGALYTSNKKRLISCFSKESEFVIPEGVEQIGSFAFYNCNITRIVIPESVSYIGDNPFIEMNLVNEKPLEVICNSHRFLVKENAIYQKKPQRLISFWGKSQQLYIEDGTIIVNPFSFYNGVRLIYLPQSVKIIHEEAFCDYFQEPQKVLVPMNSIEKFTHLIPQYKEKIVEVDLSKEWFDEYGVKYSSDKERLLFVPDDITEYKIKNGTKEICENAFGTHGPTGRLKTKLETLYIPSSVIKICPYSLQGCQYLNSIIVEETNKKFDSREKCNAIIKTETNELLYGCQSTTIPYGVKSISPNAFLSCCNLKSITIPNTVITIGESAFMNCEKLRKIFIPSSVKEIGDRAFNGSGVESVILDSNNNVYDSRENCNAIILTSDNKLVFGCRSTVIPKTVTYIGENAFECSDIEVIEIPNGVYTIGRGAFSYCEELQAVILPPSIKQINEYAFSGCTNLSSISFSNSFVDIGFDTFFGCGAIKQILIPRGSRERFEDLLKSYGLNNKIVEQDSIQTNSEIRKTVCDPLLLGEMAYAFDSFMNTINWEAHNDLEFIRKRLPLLKLHDKYILDAFQSGDNYGASYQLYVHKKNAHDEYAPSFSKYEDSMLVRRRLSESEAKDIPDILPYFTIPFTYEGIMQAWLLNSIDSYMPKSWHANYGNIQFIYKAEAIIHSLPHDLDIEKKNKILAMSSESFLPTIIIKGYEAVIRIIKWSNWSGMIRSSIKVNKQGRSVEFGEIDNDVLVEYDWGVMF